MSGIGLGDLNAVAGLEKQNDTSEEGSLPKSCTESTSGNGVLNKRESKDPPSLSAASLNEFGVSNGVEAANLEVEYIESENLKDLVSADACLSTLLARLNLKEWILTCEALNNVRQLSIYHREKLLDMLGDLIPLIVKSLKNPRSAVCKTAIMTSADIFKVYGDLTVDLFDPMLVQLLLKSSQDKRFVCEAAETALIAMTTWVSPSLLLPKLQPHLKNRSPRIRAKASMCFCRSVPRLGIEGIRAYGIGKLIQIAASQLSDQLPESREAARVLASDLRVIYEKSQSAPQSSEDPDRMQGLLSSWEEFCQAELSPLSAQAIIRVTSTPKDGSVSGC